MGGSAPSARSGHRRKLHKRPASKHLRGEADQAMGGTSSVGASLRKSDLTLAGYAKCIGRQCKVQGFKHRAICTPEAASPCILHMQLRSDRVGAFAPAGHYPFQAKATVRGRWLWTGRLRGFRRGLHRPRFTASPPQGSLGTPQAKGGSTDCSPDQMKAIARKNS